MQKLYHADVWRDSGNRNDLYEAVASALRNIDAENPDANRVTEDMIRFLQNRWVNVDESKLS